MNQIKSDQDKLNKLQRKLVTVEEEFLQVINSIDVNIRDQKLERGKWSPKDILSHIAGWEVEVIKQFKTFLVNPDVDDNYDLDSFNKSEVEARKNLTWGEIELELKTAQTELLSFLSKLTQKEIDEENRFIEWVEVLINNYIHHTKQLKQLI